jgi:hypothetical protein
MTGTELHTSANSSLVIRTVKVSMSLCPTLALILFVRDNSDQDVHPADHDERPYIIRVL